jgi:acyl carrier protein
MTADRFVADTLDWLHRRLLPAGAVADADTPLFENGLIDSIRILKLIAWTEQATGRRIPDEQIRMDHFRTVNRIAATFLGGSHVEC